MQEDIIKLFMPIHKENGQYIGILSDNSVDRDNESMSSKVLSKWASLNVIPAFIDHDASFGNMAGAWKNMTLEQKGDHHALKAEFVPNPNHPQAEYIKNTLDWATKTGITIGTSIGARPLGDAWQIKKDGVDVKEYQDAELLEASIVGIASNPNSSIYIAKALKNAEQFYLKKDFNPFTEMLSDMDKCNDGKKKSEVIKMPEDKKEEKEEEKQFVTKSQFDDLTAKVDSLVTVVDKIAKAVNIDVPTEQAPKVTSPEQANTAQHTLPSKDFAAEVRKAVKEELNTTRFFAGDEERSQPEDRLTMGSFIKAMNGGM
jgi:HK97 family phage prohead protease